MAITNVIGDIANLSGTADDGLSGNPDTGRAPVKVGGRYNATRPTLDDGDRGDVQLDTRGNLAVVLFDEATASAVEAFQPGDSSGNGTIGIVVLGHNLLFNGGSWDRARGNFDATVLASAARTATVASADQTNYNGRGLHLVIDVTAITATPSVTFTIQGKDELSGEYYTILASAAITGTGTTVLRVFPGATAAGNTVANDILPRIWRVNAVHADSDSITYSVGASIIL